MFIDSTRLSQLNKNIFGHGIFQTKKLIPDSGRMVMPDPSLPKIKRYNRLFFTLAIITNI